MSPKPRSLSAARRSVRRSVAFKVGDMFGGPTKLTSMTCFDPGGLDLVWFRRRVLQKYHANPSRFTVADNVVRCGSAWYVRYRVDSRGYVVTLLRDVALGLPLDEQHHWASENTVPPPVAPGSADHALIWCTREPDESLQECRSELGKLNRIWVRTLGWPLLRPLRSRDSSWLRVMHMPTTDEAADFAREITHVHRLTVDRLNRKQLLRYAKSRGVDQESKTLANWSDMMQSEFAMPEAEVSLILKPFRVIRDVRNAAAHSSAAELKGILKVAGLDPRRPREAFTHLVCTIATYAWRLRGEVIRKKRGHDKALPRRRAFFSPDRR